MEAKKERSLLHVSRTRNEYWNFMECIVICPGVFVVGCN